MRKGDVLLWATLYPSSFPLPLPSSCRNCSNYQLSTQKEPSVIPHPTSLILHPLSFPPWISPAGAKNCENCLKKSGAEALLVTSAPNVTYLTGFTGDSSYLLVTPEDQILISDGRYPTQIEEECPGLEMNIRRAGVLIHQQTVKVLRAAARFAVGDRSRFDDRRPARADCRETP